MSSVLSSVFPTSTSSSLWLVLGMVAFTFVYIIFFKEHASLPPSPRGMPLIGHLLLMPPIRPWIWFQKLGRQFDSPLVYLNLAGQDTVIINDYNVAIDILEKRSAKYSSRPRLVVASDYESSNKRVVVLPYNDVWRKHRAAFHREMNHQKSITYIPIQTAETQLLMHNLLRTPANFMANIRQYSANIVLKIAYGLDSENDNTQVIAGVYDVLERFLASANPGANLVDLFPSLDLLPDFLAPWRSAALEQRAITHQVFRSLLNGVRDKVSRGELAANSTFAGRLLQDADKFSTDELDVAYLAGATIFEAGTHTTAAAISKFVLAAISHPEAFKSAQAEVDAVCGMKSLIFEDFDWCEYIRAMCKETLRWRTVTAGGLPHKATTKEDDWYRGMRIPAGSTLIPNHWGMCFNAQTYGQKYEVDIFEPLRWIDRPDGVGDIGEGHPTFGFGRRICPGRHLAEQSLLLVISNLCYYFDVKAKDGVVVDTQAYTTGFNIEPEPFECLITPRPGRAAAIEQEADAAREILKHL